MTPKKFLQAGGGVLLAIGILGFAGIVGPTAGKSIFGDGWWFDMTESGMLGIVGLAAIIGASLIPAARQKLTVSIVGIVSLAIGLYSLFGQNLLGMNFETPTDTIFYLLIGVWALIVASRARDGVQEL